MQKTYFVKRSKVVCLRRKVERKQNNIKRDEAPNFAKWWNISNTDSWNSRKLKNTTWRHKTQNWYLKSCIEMILKGTKEKGVNWLCISNNTDRWVLKQLKPKNTRILSEKMLGKKCQCIIPYQAKMFLTMKAEINIFPGKQMCYLGPFSP